MKPSMISRLALLETASPEQAWEHTRGLAALLEAARRLPQREPFDETALEETGLGKLLKEARRRLGHEEEG
jgi:hypothetical protein